MSATTATRLDWDRILRRAADIVRSYSTPVTLRQLHYRLVSEQTYPNTTSAYKTLSAKSAQARRDGWFPALLDRGRTIHQWQSWESPYHAVEDALAVYRRDRTAGQDMSVYLGVEKAGMVVQLEAWFGELGVPILALSGYASQTYADDVAEHASGEKRPAVLLYAGDFDPSGEDIDRDFTERCDVWADVVRVALSAEQVQQYGLPPNPGKVTDSRAGGFIARHGELVQVELDALDPDDLRALFQQALEPFWDTSKFEAVLAQEDRDRAVIVDVLDTLEDTSDDEDDDG
jgi:hypothetical protein